MDNISSFNEKKDTKAKAALGIFTLEHNKYPDLNKVHETDDFYIATDGSRASVIFKTDDFNHSTLEKPIDVIISEAKKIITRNTTYITIKRKDLLKILRIGYSGIKEIIKNLGLDINDKYILLELKIKEKFEFKINISRSIDIIEKDEENKRVRKLVVDSDFYSVRILSKSDMKKGVRIVFNVLYFIQYLEFMQGNDLKINFYNDITKAKHRSIYSRHKDRFHFLLPVRVDKCK